MAARRYARDCSIRIAEGIRCEPLERLFVRLRTRVASCQKHPESQQQRCRGGTDDSHPIPGIREGRRSDRRPH